MEWIQLEPSIEVEFSSQLRSEHGWVKTTFQFRQPFNPDHSSVQYMPHINLDHSSVQATIMFQFFFIQTTILVQFEFDHNFDYIVQDTILSRQQFSTI